ncbi:hypothetical protein Y032_0407g906 [Ancylostoma ceylanicum]|uniref:Major facilitator superfamily (MFS) profile domain-containing protein n=1 Tax=Ancylostoma ceylanicum TaxID=53326 RepID=A0A016X4G2_9BILA|nr:hypothetical protein Y032_0407g906 [Ancylostoma ceylanicum]
MAFYDVNRFHLVVLFTWLFAVFFAAQQIFGIFSNYSPKWKCGNGTISQNCTVFKTCRNNLTFYDDYFQSAAMEFGWICSEEAYLMSAFSQLQFFGVLLGTFTFGTLSDIYGRKPVSLCTLSSGFFANLLTGFAPSWQVLHTLRFFVGLFIGGALVTLGTFVTELLLPEQRMVMRGVFNWGIARIILTTTCMLFPEWRSASIACALLLLPAILGIFFVLPESPTWLHNKGRIEEMRDAERYIARFAGIEYEAVEHKPIDHVKGVFEMLRTPGILRRLAVLWLMWFVAAFCAYGNDLNSNTIYGNLFVNQILFAVLITISKWILLAVDTWYPAFSRRNLHQGAQSIVCVCFLTLSILTIQQYKGVGVLLVNLVGSVFIEYTWDACFLCAVESLETSCRGSGTGSCSLMARFGAISAPFLTYMNNFWSPSVYFSVFVLGTINLIVSFKYLTETKGVNLDNVTAETVECDGDHFLLQRTVGESDFFVAQRHYDYIMSALFQKPLTELNKTLPKDQWISVGRVLTPTERSDYEMACALKRLIITKMNNLKKADANYQVLFVLVDKRTLRLRIDKQYYTLEEASVRYGINAEEIVKEKQRFLQTSKPVLDRKNNNKSKRQASSGDGPDSKMPRI